LTKSKTKSGHEFLAEKQDFKMDLLDFPDEILLEILSNLDQLTVHSTAALVCKTFLQLTRSSQMLKCVKVKNKTANQVQSLLVMLRDNKHLKKLILKEWRGLECLKILKVVAPHGNLRHLEFHYAVYFRVEHRDELKEVLSQICAKLTTFKFININLPDVASWTCGTYTDNGFFDPLVNAKNLTTLTLARLPRSETLRQMAENYTCLQYLDLTSLRVNVDCSENSDLASCLEKQRQTMTSLKITTCTQNPLPAISKCQNLRKLELQYFLGNINLDRLGSLSNLKSLHLGGATNSDLGNSIAIAEFQHLNEIELNYINHLSDNDVCQIAQTYGHQVCHCYAFKIV
jgi:hypothetical protein